MSTLRCVLAVVGGAAFAYAWFGAFAFGLTDFGVAMALSALCVLLIGLIRWVQRPSDKRRREREDVWYRRMYDAGSQPFDDIGYHLYVEDDGR